jgi:pimeloyl-ACP methyl ester carboxylesterase
MEETVYFSTRAGVKLCGTLTLPRSNTDTCIILCHGISVSRNYEDVFPGLALALAKQGFAVLRFDFRGHGNSSGLQTEFMISGQLEDIKAAVVFVKAAGYKKLGLAGASMGGGAAVLFAAQHPKTFKALALLFPVVDYSSLLGLKTAWSRKYFGPRAIMNLEANGFTKVGSHGFKIGKLIVEEMKVIKPWRELQKIKMPVLFVHGDADQAVPVQDSIKYSKTAKNAQLVIIAGGGHGLHDTPAVFKQTVKTATDFIIKNLQ